MWVLLPTEALMSGLREILGGRRGYNCVELYTEEGVLHLHLSQLLNKRAKLSGETAEGWSIYTLSALICFEGCWAAWC